VKAHDLEVAAGKDALDALDLRNCLCDAARAEKLEAVQKNRPTMQGGKRERSGCVEPFADGQFRRQRPGDV
jgi:hypothetical protein